MYSSVGELTYCRVLDVSGSCTVREVPIVSGHKKLVWISKPIEEAVTCGCDSSVGSFAISEVFPTRTFD